MTQLWLAWVGLRIPTVDPLPQLLPQSQAARLRNYVILLPPLLRPRPLRHLWKPILHPTTSELRPKPIRTQPLHFLMYLSRQSQVLPTTSSIVLTSHHEWSTRSISRSLRTPTTPGSYSSKRFPPRGSPNVDPEHYFYGLSGNWEWSLRTADYWRHHFEIPLVHGHHPFHNVPIETTSPAEAPRLTTKIQELAKQLSDTLTAAMASGEINDTWRTVEGMSFREAIQILQLEANFPSE